MKPKGLHKESACEESLNSLVWTMIKLPFNIWMWMATLPFRILFYLMKFDFKEWADSIDKERADLGRKTAELESLKEEKSKRELEEKVKVEREAILKRAREDRERKVAEEKRETEERRRQLELQGREMNQQKVHTQDKGKERTLEIPVRVYTERFVSDDNAVSWMPPELLNTLTESQMVEIQRTVLTPFEPLESILPRAVTLKHMEHEPTSIDHLVQKKKDSFSTNQEFAAPEVPLKRKAKKRSKARKNKQKGNTTVVAVTEPEPETVFNAVMQELLESFMDMPEVFEEPRKRAIDIPIKATSKSPVIVTVTSEQRFPSFIPLQRDEESIEKKEKEKEKEKEKKVGSPPKEEERLPTWIAVNKIPVKEQKVEIQGPPKPGELSLAPQLTPPVEETLEKPKSEEPSKQELPTTYEDTLKGKETAKREEPERRKKRRGQPRDSWERTIGTEIPPKFSVV